MHYKFSLLAVFAGAALAQTPPDAGRTLQEQVPVIQAPKASRPVAVERAAPIGLAPGGLRAAIERVRIDGNTLFTEQQLLSLLGDIKAQSWDLAQLRQWAEQISDFYHQQGYRFAHAYVPAQAVQGGVLHIEVIEGKYGQVLARTDPLWSQAAQAFLAPLKTGGMIQNSLLERTTLILDDLPGVKTSPILKPGQALGSGDLDVRVERTARVTGDAGLDNQGNRYTGQWRAHFNAQLNSPFMLGDQLSFRSLITQGALWFGDLSYSAPVGSSGLRGQLTYSHTSYELGKDFANLQAGGRAKLGSVGVSYPALRSQRANLKLTSVWQHKQLHDEQAATASSSLKSSQAWVNTLNFDLRDSFAGAGISYGSLIWTTGRLNLDAALNAADRITAQTAGRFNKFNLDLARFQNIARAHSVYARVSYQWADKNLDSSERMSLGGPAGVRAYPLGEGLGDKAWFAQFEWRHAMGAWSPYAFYDFGLLKVNAKPWQPLANKRSISGAGIGLRYQANQWIFDGTVACRVHGGAPQSDTQDSRPRGWLALGYKF